MNTVPFSWPQLIVVAIGMASPVLSHLVLTKGVPLPLRKGLTYAIAALGAVITQVAYQEGETWKAYLLAIFYAWAAMVIAHFSGIPDAVREKTPHLGIGPKPRRKFAGVKVTEGEGPPAPPKSPGRAQVARQSKLRRPK